MSTSSQPIANPKSITSAQRKALRGLGHALKPVIRIGRQGISDGLIAATIEALEDHELIKIAVTTDCPLPRKEAPHALAKETGSHVAGVIGRTGLLYRRHDKEPKVVLPGKIEDPADPADLSESEES